MNYYEGIKRGELGIRDFRSHITREMATALSVNAVAACIVIASGVQMSQTWPAHGAVFIVGGLAILVLAVWMARNALNRQIRVSRYGFAYFTPTERIQIPWAQLAVTQPHRPDRRWFRTTAVSDKQTTVVIESHLFDDYDTIVTLLKHGKKRAPREEMLQL